MSIMIDARLRLLEARVAEIERRLAGVGAASTPDGAIERQPDSGRRAAIQKPSKRARKSR